MLWLTSGDNMSNFFKLLSALLPNSIFYFHIGDVQFTLISKGFSFRTLQIEFEGDVLVGEDRHDIKLSGGIFKIKFSDMTYICRL
jgi:hypothetical protein